MLRGLVFICFFLYSTVLPGQTSDSDWSEGGITGVVMTEDGRFAEEGEVCLTTLEDNGLRASTVCPAVVGKDGHFRLEDLKPGHYRVYAINESEGYTMDNQNPGQDVVISAQNLCPDVTVRFHDAGSIVTGVITDSKTGKTLFHATLNYIGLDCDQEGGSALQTKERFSLVVPKDCDLVLIAQLKNYKGWVYMNGGSPILRLAAGERKNINIQLDPIDKGIRSSELSKKP